MIEVTPTASVNCLVVLSSLRADERGLSTRVFDDVETNMAQQDVEYEFHELQSAVDLRRILADVERRALVGMRPMLHFDMHGSELDGLWIASSNEHLSWTEIAVQLRRINDATENNLCIVSLACFGFRLMDGLSMDLLTPFYLLIAPEIEVEAGFLDEALRPFYRSLFSSLDLVSAYNDHLASKTSFFHCERFCIELLVSHIVEERQGARKAAHVERLVSAELAKGSKLSKQKLRSLARQHLTPSAELVKRTQADFLGGKPASFTFLHVMQLVKEANAHRQKYRSSAG